LKAYQVYINRGHLEFIHPNMFKIKLLSKTIIWILLWTFEKTIEIKPFKILKSP
jgi:hypothetical protein